MFVLEKWCVYLLNNRLHELCRSSHRRYRWSSFTAGSGMRHEEKKERRVVSSEPRRKLAIKENNSGGSHIVPMADVDPAGSRGTLGQSKQWRVMWPDPDNKRRNTVTLPSPEGTDKFPCNFACGWRNVVSMVAFVPLFFALKFKSFSDDSPTTCIFWADSNSWYFD